MDFQMAESYAKDQAERLIEGQVLDAIEENLPEDVDPRDWNWEALAKMVNTRWRLSVRDRDLKRLGRDGVGEMLIEKAREAVQKTDLGQGERFLEPDFGVQTVCAWVKHKFGVELDLDGGPRSGVRPVRGQDPRRSPTTSTTRKKSSTR